MAAPHNPLTFEDFEEEDLIVLMLIRRHRKNKRKARKEWVQPILQKRKEHGEFHRLVKELMLDSGRFKQYFRVDLYISCSPCHKELVFSKYVKSVARRPS